MTYNKFQVVRQLLAFLLKILHYDLTESVLRCIIFWGDIYQIKVNPLEMMKKVTL